MYRLERDVQFGDFESARLKIDNQSPKMETRWILLLTAAIHWEIAFQVSIILSQSHNPTLQRHMAAVTLQMVAFIESRLSETSEFWLSWHLDCKFVSECFTIMALDVSISSSSV